MAADPDVEDSQIVGPVDEAPPYKPPSSPPRGSPGPRPGIQKYRSQQYGDREDTISKDHIDVLEPDSYTSRVDETQWVLLEPESPLQETQVTQQQSIPLMEETQIVDIGLVTQAVTQYEVLNLAETSPAPVLLDPHSQLSPASQRVLQLTAEKDAILHPPSSSTFIPLISRLKNDLEDVSVNFQFAPPPPRGHYSRPPGKSNGGATFEMPEKVADLPMKAQSQACSRQDTSDPRRVTNDHASQSHNETSDICGPQKPPTPISSAISSPEYIISQRAAEEVPLLSSADKSLMNPPTHTLNSKVAGITSVPTAVSKTAQNSTDPQLLKHLTIVGNKGPAKGDTIRSKAPADALLLDSNTGEPVPHIRTASVGTPTRRQSKIRAACGSRTSILANRPFSDADTTTPIVPTPNAPFSTAQQPRGGTTRHPLNPKKTKQALSGRHSKPVQQENATATSAAIGEHCSATDQSPHRLVPLSRDFAPQVSSQENSSSLCKDQKLGAPKRKYDAHDYDLPEELQSEPKMTSLYRQINGRNHHHILNNPHLQNIQPHDQNFLDTHDPSTTEEGQQDCQDGGKQQQGRQVELTHNSNDAQNPMVDQSLTDDCQSSVQPESRPSSSISRPQSRHSNHLKSMNRPFPEYSIHLEGPSKSLTSDFCNSSKVKKSKASHNKKVNGQAFVSISDSGSRQISSKPLSDFKIFLQNAQDIEEYLKMFEQQTELVEVQKGVIEGLHSSNTDLGTRISSLEGEKQILTKKINNLRGICEKYKTHMNDVVISQRALMSEALEMKSNRKAASQEAKAILEEVRGYSFIQEAQSKKFHSINGGFKEVKRLAAQTNDQQNALTHKVEDLTRILLSLDVELNTRVAELGREKHHVKQLQKQLATQSSSHKELVELLKTSESNLIDELTKEDGALGKILNSGNLSLAKVEELSILINNLETDEPSVPLALVTLIEDVYARLEKKLQATDQSSTAHQESDTKFFEEIKERINQVLLNQQAKIQLDGQLLELREENVTMTTRLRAREAEIEGLSTRINQLGRDLTNYHDQLAAKNDQLTTFLASPRDDPRLRSRVHELENANTTLQRQLDAANEETNSAKSELKSLEETSWNSKNQLRDLEQDLRNAQSLIKSAEECKAAFVANAKAEIEKARQEVAQSAKASKNELQKRHECQVKNLEQRRSELESQLAAAKDVLEKIYDERRNGLENESKLGAELSLWKEQHAQQSAQIKSLIEEMPSQELLEVRAQGVQFVRDELTEVTSAVQAGQHARFQELEGVRQTHMDLGAQISQVVATLKEQNERLQEQNIQNVQNKYIVLSGSPTHHLNPTGDFQSEVFLEKWATTVPSKSPQNMGPSRRSVQSGSSTASVTTAGPNLEGQYQRTVHQNMTPREALQLSNDRRPAALRNGDPDYLKPTESNRKPSSNLARDKETTIYANSALAESAAESAISKIKKPLRAANRKRSIVAKESDAGARILHRTRSMSGSLPSEVTCSTVTRTTHKTEETTIRVETPRCATVAFQDTPHGSASSSLTEVDIYDISDSITSQGRQDKLQHEYEWARRAKAGLSSTGRNFTNQVQTRNSSSQQSNYMPHDNFSSKHHSDQDELANNFIRKPVSAPVKNPQVSTPQQLKSALKNSSRIEQNQTAGKLSATAQSGLTNTAPPAALQNQPHGRGVNKSMSRSAGPRGGSDYNRVVSGMSRKPHQNSDPRGYLKSPPKQHSAPKDNSPLPPASKRNSQKRKQSGLLAETRDNSSRGRKEPRLSLPPSRPGRQIADSHEMK